MLRSCWTILVAGLLVTLLPAVRGAAESSPSRPIELIVAYTPGDNTDVTARLVTEQLRSILGQPVVIENKGVASANIGAAAAAKSEPDGYLS